MPVDGASPWIDHDVWDAERVTTDVCTDAGAIA